MFFIRLYKFWESDMDFLKLELEFIFYLGSKTQDNQGLVGSASLNVSLKGDLWLPFTMWCTMR